MNVKRDFRSGARKAASWTYYHWLNQHMNDGPTLPKGWTSPRDENSGSGQTKKIGIRRIAIEVIFISIISLLAIPVVSDYLNEIEKLQNYIIIPFALGAGLWYLALVLIHSKTFFSFVVAFQSLGAAALISSEVLGKIRGINNAGFDPYYTAMMVILFFSSLIYALSLLVGRPEDEHSSRPTLPLGYSAHRRAKKADSDEDYDNVMSRSKRADRHDDANDSRDDGGGWDDFGGD